MTTKFKPTDEQAEAVKLFASGENLAIEAGAGTGKTSTLQLISESTPKKGKYLAFNKAIVVDSSQKMPKNVECKTAHSLAFGQVVGKNPKYKERLNAPRQRLEDVVRFLKCDSFTVFIGGDSKTIDSVRVAAIVNNTIYNFCCSADREITVRHVPYIEGIDEPESYTNNNILSQYVVPIAQRAWEDIVNPGGFLQFKHEHYLKIFQLNNPKIYADFILFDEAQDANPVMLDIVAQQKNAQLVFVGDSNQQIYEFTGAVNAMGMLPNSNRTFLTKSFRFGHAIADAANHILEMLDTEMKIIGFEAIDSSIGIVDKPDCILVRTNAGAIGSIISELMTDRKVAYVGNVDEIINFIKACQTLQFGRKTMHPELMCFDSWDELVEYAAIVEDKSLDLMIKLINQYTAATIVDSFKRLVDEKDADIVISTAHKSKGREWNNVFIGGDFPEDMQATSDAEKRLMYVAVTRAQRILDVSNVDIFESYYREV